MPQRTPSRASSGRRGHRTIRALGAALCGVTSRPHIDTTAAAAAPPGGASSRYTRTGCHSSDSGLSTAATSNVIGTSGVVPRYARVTLLVDVTVSVYSTDACQCSAKLAHAAAMQHLFTTII